MNIEELILKIKADVSELDKAGDKIKDFGKKTSDITKPFLTAGTVIGGALGFMVKAAADSEKAWNGLMATMKASGKYTDDAYQSLQQLATQMQNTTGISDEVVASAARMGYQFGLSTDAIKQLLPVAANLSVAMGVDMATAMQRMGTVFEGNYMALRRYGIDLSDFQSKMKSLEKQIEDTQTQLEKVQEKYEAGKISTSEYKSSTAVLTATLNDLQKQYEQLQQPQMLVNEILSHSINIQGLAEEQGKTLAGQISKLKEQLMDIAEKIGGVLIPVIKDMIDKYVEPWIQKFNEIPAEKVEKGVKMVAEAVIFLVGVGVLGKLIQMVTNLINIFTNLGMLFTPQGLVVAGLGLLVLAIIEVVKHWDSIKKAFEGFYEKWIKPWLEPLLNGLQKVINFFKQIFDFFKNVGSKISATLNPAGNTAEITLGGFASGGYVSKPTLAWVAEKEPEYIIPQSKMGFNIVYNIQTNTSQDLLSILQLHDNLLVNKIKGVL
ncbi:MAG: phage tail tape measure protein [Candidatus Bilamarchaeaceae archaeon]